MEESGDNYLSYINQINQRIKLIIDDIKIRRDKVINPQPIQPCGKLDLGGKV